MTATKLQHRFANSRIIRRAMIEYLISEGVPAGRGYLRIWRKIANDVFSEMPEIKIKQFLIELYYTCNDLSPAERAEIIELLQLSSTALTTEQLEDLKATL